MPFGVPPSCTVTVFVAGTANVPRLPGVPSPNSMTAFIPDRHIANGSRQCLTVLDADGDRAGLVLYGQLIC